MGSYFLGHQYRNYILKSDINITTRVAGKENNVAVNIGIVMMMITNKSHTGSCNQQITLHRMMVEELTRQKETEERRVLLKNVRMELMTKVEQIELKLQRKLQHRQMVLTELM